MGFACALHSTLLTTVPSPTAGKGKMTDVLANNFVEFQEPVEQISLDDAFSTVMNFMSATTKQCRVRFQ